MHWKLGTTAGVAVAAMLAASPASALKINLTDIGATPMSAQAAYGFRAAARFWEERLTDNIDVGLNIQFGPVGGPNVIGQTGSLVLTGVTISDTYQLLALDSTSALDTVSVANQQTLVNGAVSVITQQSNPGGGVGQPAGPFGVKQNVRVNGVETVSNREFDNDGSINNSQIRINTATIKALGIDLTGVAGYAGTDATVTFNSAFNFDFNPTNGIGVGQTDFIGTAIHEIGHALGFTSGVDTYDNNTNFTGNYDNLARATILDLFRFSDNPTGLGGGGRYLDWSVGNAVGGRPFFSFDGGLSRGLASYGGDEGYFSTGAVNGDGRQASHFQDTPYMAVAGDQGPGMPRCLAPIGGSRGIMDPTFAPCELGIITSLDFAAFDAIGWDLSHDVLGNIDLFYTSADAFDAIPEPSTWATLLLGFGLLGTTLRASRRRLARVRA